MLRKDYLVRQLEEFGKFLGIVFGLKNKNQWAELEELINTSSQKYTSLEITEIEKLQNNDLIDHLVEKKDLKETQLKMLADLLYEKGISYLKRERESESNSALQKALLIYRYIKDNSLETDFSLDMHFKIQAIEQLLEV